MVQTVGDQQIRWVVGCAAVLAVVGVGVSLGLGRVDYAVGIAVGGAIALANLWMLTRLVRRMMAPGGAGASVGLFLLKMGLLGGVLFGAFKLVPMDVLGFTLGLSVVVLAVTLSAIFGPVPSDEPADPAMTDDGSPVGTE